MSLWSEAIVSHVFSTVECRVVVVDALVIEGHALFRLVFRMLFVFVPFVAFAFDIPPSSHRSYPRGKELVHDVMSGDEWKETLHHVMY